MKYRKRHSKKRSSILSRINVRVLIFVSLGLGGLLLATGYIYIFPDSQFSLKIADTLSGVFPGNGFSVSQPGAVSLTNTADELTQIDDASSEQDGKWRGLCKKRSIHSLEDFRASVENDPVLSQYYAGFNWEEAKMGNLKEDVMAYVAHRKGEVIKKTARPIKLPKGDGYVTDGKRTARTYCCNDIDMTPSAGNSTPDLPVTPAAGSSDIFPPAAPPLFSLPISDFPISHDSNPGSGPPDDSTDDPSTPVPEPGTLLLMSLGLLSLAAIRRKG